MFKRWMLILLCVLLIGLCACNSIPKEPLLGLCLPPEGDSWEGSLITYARQAAQDEGVQFVETYSSTLPGALLEAVQEMIEQKVHAVVMYAEDSQQAQEAAALLAKKKIPLILIGDDHDIETYTELVSYDNYAIGAAAAQAIAQRLDGVGSVLILKGKPGAVTEERCQGFRDTLAQYPQMEIFAEDSAGGREDIAYSITSIWLEEGQFDAVFSEDDHMAMGAIRYLEEELCEEVQIVTGVGGCKDALEMIMKNHRYFKATWAYSPAMGGEAVHRAMRIIFKEEIPKDEKMPMLEYTAKNAVVAFDQTAVY